MDQPRILIVDDNPSALWALEGFLDEQPYQVMTASSGEAALGILRCEQIHLAVVDYRMPDMDGLMLVQKLRAEHIKADVLMITGFASVDLAVKAMQMGVVDFLEKPFDKSTFVEKVEGCLPRTLEGWPDRLEAYLMVHWDNPNLSLEDLKDDLEISVGHLCRLFRKHFNTTFTKRVQHIRVERAKTLIKTTDLLFYEIAETCGFRSQQVFSVVFRNHTGKKPSEYRRL